LKKGDLGCKTQKEWLLVTIPAIKHAKSPFFYVIKNSDETRWFFRWGFSKFMSWRCFFLTENLFILGFLYFWSKLGSRVARRAIWIWIHDPLIPSQLPCQWATPIWFSKNWLVWRDGPWPNPSIILIRSKEDANLSLTLVLFDPKGKKIEIFVALRENFPNPNQRWLP